MQGASALIITSGAVVTALLTLFGVARSIYFSLIRRHDNAVTSRDRSSAQEDDIARLKEENTLICYGLLAALDGLEQLGANHTVPEAKAKIERYINKQAHK